MANSRFVYVTYIRTTPEKLWQALVEPDFTRRYWFGISLESEWKSGGPWQMMLPDGRVADAGEVLEIEPQRRLVLSWRNEFRPDLKAEGYSRMICELEPQGEMVRLTIVHEIERDGAKLIEAVSGGWPLVLASLKSFLETGEPLSRPLEGAKCG